LNRVYVTKKTQIVAASITILCILLYIFLRIITPSEIIDKTIGAPYKNPDRLNGIFYSLLLRLFVLGILLLAAFRIFNSIYFPKISEVAVGISRSFSKLLNLNLLFFISLVYLAVLFVTAVMNYDLGTDEAWYVCVGENFAKTLIPYFTSNGKLFIIDTISMLPYYAACFINFGFGLTEVWHFKLFASILSVSALIAMFWVTSKLYGKPEAVLFLFFLVLQPGFGFIASSYFGELFQALFIFTGLYIWLRDSDKIQGKSIIFVSLLFTAAIHTKFQLIFILSLVLIIMHFTDRKSLALKLLFYTILFSVMLSAVRTLPVLIKEPSSLRSLVVINLFAEQTSITSFAAITEKFQLLNRFFPASIFAIIALSFSFFCMKNAFDRFVFLFSSVTVLWWVFLYPFSPYRVPFMGFIFLALMAARVAFSVYSSFAQKFPARVTLFRYAAALSAVLLMLYGFSANLVYAYIGYNDGVQFDLDGFRSRLFTEITRDNSQKEFFEELKKNISPEDTLYNCYSVTMFYVKNPVFRLDKLKESLEYSKDEKLVLVTRDMFPLGFEKIYSELDSIGGGRRLILKKPGHELYGITKQRSPSP
jgi:hypothetical protein